LDLDAASVGFLPGMMRWCGQYTIPVTTRVSQERYCKPYISLPATGMRAVRISPDSASVM
jgi:hypothetical protein